MVPNETKAPHYLILTGLQFVEAGVDGRRLQLVACVEPATENELPRVNGAFLAADGELPKPGSKRSAACQNHGRGHRYYTLMEALENRLLPMGEDGGEEVGIPMPELVSAVLRWQRSPRPTALKRVAS